MLGRGTVCCQKVVTSSQVSKAKCNHDRDEMMRGSEREGGERGWRGQADQMSAPEDENELDGQRLRAKKNKAGEGGTRIMLMTE